MRTSLTILLCVLITSLHAQNAYIQVESEPGISVFLDGSFKGKTTSSMGGLIIENVSPGSHTIKVLKDGFNPQEDRITVKAGEVYSYKVRPFVPRLKITETGNTGQQEMDLKVGKLKIQSLPVSISIIIPALGVNNVKSKDEWNVEEVPVGSYAATFKGMNKILTHTIEIKYNQLTHVFINMVSGKIENRSPKYDNYSGVNTSGAGGSNVSYGSFKDSRDGKIYKTVQIGNQVWMAENLGYKPSFGNYWAYGNSNTNVAVYGYLYDWETANKVCPSGWHLPTDSEWTQLTNYLGGAGVAGGKLKEIGTTHWDSPNTGATNETGFTALPGGNRSDSGFFYDIGLTGSWWSASEGNADDAWYRNVYYDGSDVNRYFFSKVYGFSVCCLRD